MAFWAGSIEDTATRAERPHGRRALGGVGEWLRQYADECPTTSNQGSGNVPFQRWFRFKEAFSPKFVADTMAALPYEPRHCIDPFGGSGTTALTCSFLGIDTTTIEVNPFLADLIEAKLSSVRVTALCDAYGELMRDLDVHDTDRSLPPDMPRTLREPGVKEKFVFSAEVFDTARMLARRLNATASPEVRLLRVLLGSVLVENSNTVVNGKGRRYRGGWQRRVKNGNDLLASFDAAVSAATTDIVKFSARPVGTHRVLRGDSRKLIGEVGPVDTALFSPPYPNSFDYTDVYNLELWLLGHLDESGSTTRLRHSTLRSHVQIRRPPPKHEIKSDLLRKTVAKLELERESLWNPTIPSMVAAYFEDLDMVFDGLAGAMKKGNRLVMVVGDCQYAGVHVDVAGIIEERTAHGSWDLVERSIVRSMRSSSQHGGKFDLHEHCIVLQRSKG